MPGTLAISFDNLGAAAEIGAGAMAVDDPGVATHPTVTEALPQILTALEKRSLTATFFVEGLNAELYPEALRGIDAGGHEIGFHAWQHEEWGALGAAEQVENLARGRSALEAIGIGVAGFRPPGGSLGAGGLEAIRDAGFRYCSPAGDGAGVEAGVAVLPFRWLEVDASCVLPPLGSVRRQMTGSADSVSPDDFLSHLGRRVSSIAATGGLAVFVLHPFMLAWLGLERLEALLDRVATAATEGSVRVVGFGDAAEAVIEGRVGGGFSLDPTSWA